MKMTYKIVTSTQIKKSFANSLMSSKVNKTKLTKKIKPTKANNEIRKTKDTKATIISTTHKTMKKNTRQLNKPHQPPSNQKYVETNNDKIIHEKKRSASAKKPNSKESTVKLCLEMEKTEKLLNESEVFLTDIITVAPPNKNLMIQNRQKLDELGDVIYNRCEKLLRCLIDHGVKAVVFGAFGCGACGNDPKKVSPILRDLIIRKGYGRFLDVVVFAVGDGDDAGGKSKNFQQFKKTFRV